MRLGVLYITYDGLLEPLGQSQVLAYLEKLAAGRKIRVLSFEKAGDWADIESRNIVAQRVRAAGIHWHPRRYHKRPSAPATAWDIVVGLVVALWLVVRHRIGIVHARSYVPAVMALAIKNLTGARFLFDMRGFWADERVDAESWAANGRMYRMAKWFERKFLVNADHVVSLTHAAVTELQRFDYLQGRMPPITVIPTCADLERFRVQPRIEKNAPFTLGYVGSADGWYLFDAAVAAFTALRSQHPDAKFLIVNRGAHAYIRERLAQGGVAPDAVELRQAPHEQVPALMARMNAGVFFIKPVFSKQASAPTKLAEFLGCGIPVLANSGVGDMAEILRSGNVGVVVDAFDDASLRVGVHKLLSLAGETDVRARCRAVAECEFALGQGVQRYEAVYSRWDMGAK